MTMRHALLVRGLAVLTAAGLMTTTPAWAAPGATRKQADPIVLRAELVIDTGALGEGGPSMKEVLARLETDVLRDRGVGPAASDTDPQIVVVVRPLVHGTGVFDNRVEVSIVQNGEAWPDASWGFDCSRCSDGHLLNKVGITLHSVVTRLEEAAREAEVAAGTSEEPAEDDGAGGGDEVQPASRADEGETPKPGPLVWAGGATALVGAVGIGVGLALALREDRIEGGLEDPKRVGVQTRTPGWVTTGLGAAAVVTGGALLTVGLLRWSRAKRQQSAAAKTVVVPWASREHVGLGVHGRF